MVEVCNVDASLHNRLSKTSAGWCVRDFMGHFVVAGTSWKHGNLSVIEEEAEALIAAIQEIANRGFTNVVFETDSKNVVDSINQNRVGVSEFSSLISKIKCLLSLHSSFKVNLIKRQGNMVARCPHTCSGRHFLA
ncbi:cytochrome p450 [Trifolium pratense]|uniref:Cytochrome p450 n=1 Tax=Trifolium pratense TaxID=57577 RepID=A0A2K3M2D9_TRIPR|nr:cytochrome p450 [Trifolium pratense]